MLPLQRLLCVASLVAAALCAGPVRSAEVDAADYGNLKARVAAFDESISSYRLQIQRLRDEAVRLRAENDALRIQASAARNGVSQEQLNRLAQQIREIERNQTRDKQQVLDAMDRLKNLAPVHAANVARAPARKPVSQKAVKKVVNRPVANTAVRKATSSPPQ